MKKAAKTILIIEDEKDLLKVLSEEFGRQGFTVLNATDGKSGLATALKNKPALILLDILMPKMDGLQMLAHLRRNEWGKKVPVIVLTNLNDAQAASQALNAGVHDYLVKADWSLEKIVAKVRARLGLSSQ